CLPSARMGVKYASAIRGSNGKTMPKPSRSMNTTRKTITSAEREEERDSVRGGAGTDSVGSKFRIALVGHNRSKDNPPPVTLGNPVRTAPVRAAGFFGALGRLSLAGLCLS